ncbi:hypothetical protein BDV93DRAFT_546793 [Ceratobasidium sp. AG-I]|nr:hypothetical protein BDV93DRAFT_546793 [Ceratobasidium sp. AG-I]
MSSPARNFPPFSPDNKYQHRIDANAAWIKSKPSPDRRPPPVVERLTPWGTAYPLFHKNDHILVQFNSADVIKCDIEEKSILPRHFEHRVLSNAPCFKVTIFLAGEMIGERVLVQTSDGPKAQTHIGKITYVGEDKITRDKDTWHIVPRLYQVYLEQLGTEGCWTKESIIRMGPSPPGLAPPPGLAFPPGLSLPTPSPKRP